MKRRLVLYTDGAARGNPGPAGVGAVLYQEGEGRPVRLDEVSRAIGTATNNVAEYQALLDGLAVAERFAPDELVVRADSQLLVRQITGHYRVKAPGLRALHGEAVRRLARFPKVRIEHVPRERNAEADTLANAALDLPMGDASPRRRAPPEEAGGLGGHGGPGPAAASDPSPSRRAPQGER